MQPCEHCGHPNRSGVCFCARCGSPLKWDLQSGRIKIGATLDQRYVITRALKMGGMGAIYLAQDQRLGNQTVIVKEMLDRSSTPQERQYALQAFEREALLLSSLRHTQIPRVSNHFRECGRYYLVMDYVPGMNLDEMWNQNHGAPLDEATVTTWAIQLCDVLCYLHEHQPPIIFRDLKPSNIMLQPDGQIRLIDFGIARHFLGSQLLTPWGTPGYTPLEQVQGQAEPRSDLYALGATMHHLLSGRAPVPFQFPPLRQMNPRISVALESVVAAALSLYPQDRPASAREFRELLENLGGKFTVSVDWAHPVLDMNSSPLGQFRVKIISSDTTVRVAVQTHFCLLLDVSGSMRYNNNTDVSQQKYWPLLQATQHLVNLLPESDLLSIFIFAERSDMLLAAALVEQAKSQSIGGANGMIDGAPLAKNPGNHTNLYNALEQAIRLTEQFQRPNLVHRFLLLTDGQIHDLETCEPLFEKLESSAVECYAYGFGLDWQVEPLKGMLTNVPGGSFKPVSTSPNVSTFDIRNTFSRFAQASQTIIATNPRLEVKFHPHVKPNDVFRYSPIARSLGNAANQNNTFDTVFEAMEAGKEYTWCFEVRVQPTTQSMQPIGTVTLIYDDQGRTVRQRQTISVERSADAALVRRVDPEVDEIFTFLEFLRSDSPQKQLQALMARRDIAVRKGYDPEHINALENAIRVLQNGGLLDELPIKDQLWVRADPRGATSKLSFHS